MAKAPYAELLSEAILMYTEKMRKQIRKQSAQADKEGKMFILHEDFADYLEIVWRDTLGTDVRKNNVHSI